MLGAPRRTKREVRTLALAGLALAAVAGSAWHTTPRLIWNVTSSVEIGLYWISPRSTTAGDIVAVRLPAAIAEFAHARGYLPRSALLLKPVAAARGDHVCRWGSYILINGRPRAIAAHRDQAGRTLPVWTGCRTLRPDEVFVLSRKPESFDGRYFGVLTRLHVEGRASLI
jgi:conjugative transfer signal peptidase TraF